MANKPNRGRHKNNNHNQECQIKFNSSRVSNLNNNMKMMMSKKEVQSSSSNIQDKMTSKDLSNTQYSRTIRSSRNRQKFKDRIKVKI